ncbi:MAG: hypothetical protein SGBAC_009466, partial [Bacillariaceae sp.]
EVADMGMEIAREDNPDFILRHRTSLPEERESHRDRFPSELTESSLIKEVRVSRLRMLESEAESSSESHSIVGKLSTVVSAKERSKREEESVTSKLVLLFRRSLLCSPIFKASVAGHDGSMLYVSIDLDVMFILVVSVQNLCEGGFGILQNQD